MTNEERAREILREGTIGLFPRIVAALDEAEKRGMEKAAKIADASLFFEGPSVALLIRNKIS